MSDGMSDARAVGAIGRDLEIAAAELRRAINRALAGHRGLSVDVEATVNDYLLYTGFRLRAVPEERR